MVRGSAPQCIRRDPPLPLCQVTTDVQGDSSALSVPIGNYQLAVTCENTRGQDVMGNRTIMMSWATGKSWKVLKHMGFCSVVHPALKMRETISVTARHATRVEEKLDA